MNELFGERLTQVVGAQHATFDDERAVARPGSAAEIADILRVAREAALPVAVGIARGIAIDLSRMRSVLHLDETSLLVSVQAGVVAGDLAQLLAERGLEMAPLPSWSRGRTIGALLAAPRPAEASPRAGRFATTCAGIVGLLADGTEIASRIAPRKATGPDLWYALAGARGTTGMITSATLRIFRRADVEEAGAWRFATPAAALLAARALLAQGARPHDLAVRGTDVSVATSGPAGVAAAEREQAGRVMALRGGAPASHVPPPRVETTPREQALAMEAIESAAGALASASARVAGWHAMGAALVDTAGSSRPASLPPLGAALKRTLDPEGRFPSWPGS